MKYLVLVILSSFFSTILFADTLKCSFTRYNASSASVNIAKEWLPEIQFHEINKNEAFFKTKWMIKGKVSQNDDDKIKWSYNKEVKLKIHAGAHNQKTILSKFNFVFFKSNNKVAADVTFPSQTYLPIDNIWGTCKLEN